MLAHLKIVGLHSQPIQEMLAHLKSTLYMTKFQVLKYSSTILYICFFQIFRLYRYPRTFYCTVKVNMFTLFKWFLPNVQPNPVLCVNFVWKVVFWVWSCRNSSHASRLTVSPEQIPPYQDKPCSRGHVSPHIIGSTFFDILGSELEILNFQRSLLWVG